MIPPLDVSGDKVALRLFTADDIRDDYVGWLNDPIVTRFSNQRFATHDRASCEAYLRSFEGSPNLFLAVLAGSGGPIIGTMTAYRAPQHGTADLGILIGERSCWGQGYAGEGWALLSQWLIDEADVRKLTAGTLAVNAPMIRLAERSGMTLEGRRERQEVFEGAEVDILYFARFANR